MLFRACVSGHAHTSLIYTFNTTCLFIDLYVTYSFPGNVVEGIFNNKSLLCWFAPKTKSDLIVDQLPPSNLDLISKNKLVFEKTKHHASIVFKKTDRSFSKQITFESI